MNSIVENYASALFEIYLEVPNSSFSDDLKLLKAIFKKEDDLIKLLSSPMLLKFERSAIVDVIFRQKISGLLVNFLHVLIVNGSFIHILAIINATLKKIDLEKGICFAIVETPFALEVSQIDKIKKAIEKRKQSLVEVDVVINESLIGGLKITLGTEVIDGSIKHKLAQIKKGVENSK